MKVKHANIFQGSLLMVVLLFLLSACGGGGDGGTPASQNGQPPAQQTCTEDGVAPSTVASSYMLAAPQNLPDPNGSTELVLSISGPTGTRGIVEIAGVPYSHIFRICTSPVKMIIPSTAMLSGNQVVEGKGISIQTDASVQIQFTSYHTESANFQTISSDGYVAIPVENTDTTYIVNGIGSTAGISGFAITASSNNTQVTTTVSDTSGSLLPGQTDVVSLNAGESIQYLSNIGGDLSRSQVSATGSVSVFSFNSLAQVPDGVDFGSFLIAQLLPVSSLGSAHYASNYSTRTNSTVRIIGTASNTTLTIGAMGTTINALQPMDFTLTTKTKIFANKPISVMQFSHGEKDDLVASSDPFMNVVPGTSRLSTSSSFSVPDRNIGTVFVDIAVPTTEVSLLQLNNSPVSASLFAAVDGTYSHGQVPITESYNSLTTSGTGFLAILYGYGTTPPDVFGNGVPNGVGMAITK